MTTAQACDGNFPVDTPVSGCFLGTFARLQSPARRNKSRKVRPKTWSILCAAIFEPDNGSSPGRALQSGALLCRVLRSDRTPTKVSALSLVDLPRATGNSLR